MSTTSPLLYLLLVTAGLAWTLAIRRPEHRAMAALISWAPASDLLRAGLQRLVLAPARAAHGLPHVWPARAWFHLEQALLLSWPCAILGGMLVALRGMRPRVAVGVAGGLWVASTAVIAVQYPELRRERLSMAIAVFWSLVVLAILAAGIAGVVRFARAARAWGPAQWVLGSIAVGEVGVAVVAWTEAGALDATWDVVRAGYAIAWLVGAGYLAVEVWRARG